MRSLCKLRQRTRLVNFAYIRRKSFAVVVHAHWKYREFVRYSHRRLSADISNFDYLIRHISFMLNARYIVSKSVYHTIKLQVETKDTNNGQLKWANISESAAHTQHLSCTLSTLMIFLLWCHISMYKCLYLHLSVQVTLTANQIQHTEHRMNETTFILCAEHSIFNGCLWMSSLFIILLLIRLFSFHSFSCKMWNMICLFYIFFSPIEFIFHWSWPVGSEQAPLRIVDLQ